MSLLGFTISDLESLGGIHTAREIEQQPALWMKVWQLVMDERKAIEKFLENKPKVDQVILTGAGTSAFIGDSLVGTFHRQYHPCTVAVPTTHLVSHPHDYFLENKSILLISFARSGNSPESEAVVQLADDLCKRCYHLIITCNGDGELAKCQTKNAKYVFLLPQEANDQSLAMTSSYTGMLLTALLIADLGNLGSAKMQVETAAKYASYVLGDPLQEIKEIAALPFKRAVFLGSGPLYGTATESHLKLQELTDGSVVCKHDSFLGFRHGPKAVVDNETLMVYLFSNRDYVSKYEKDLVLAMKNGKKAIAQVGIGEHCTIPQQIEHQIHLSNNGSSLEEAFLCLPAIIPSQVLGFFKSLREGRSPDQPSDSGAISRVVQGVNIYTFTDDQYHDTKKI